MSAVPSVPQETLETDTSNADAALQHLLQSKQASTVDASRKTTESPPWLLHDAPVENQRRIKVIVVGAGYSGVFCGIRIPEKIRNCELVIYEKNAGIGGTWYENRYPGAACDIPSHSYQFSFNPKHDWSALYAPAPEIREYIQSTAVKYGADRFVKLRHKVTAAKWEQKQGKWHVTVEGPDGSTFEDVGDVLIAARGNLNEKVWPDIPGLGDFQGEIIHSAQWNEDYDFTNKRIGIIGSGSSAIQIVPQLQKVPGANLNCFIRGRTWISPPFGQTTQDRYGLDEFTFTPEMVAKFARDPQAWMDFRLDIESDLNNIHALTLRGTPMQVGAQKAFDQSMKDRLVKKPHYYDWLCPRFSPGCKRLTPGPGFLEALIEDNVKYVPGAIARIDPTAVVTADGQRHEIDVLICATGFAAGAAPPFPVTGLDGRLQKEHWRMRPTNYLSLATDGFPNYFFMLGPNAAIAEGSLLMMIECTGAYIVKAIRKLQKENIKSMTVKPERVHDFIQYCDTYFQGTVFVDDCSSWYKKRAGQGGNETIVTGLWPGSTLHCIEALRSPRWEDYLYEYLPEDNGAVVNQLGWLGNGWGVTQLGEKPSREQLGFYLLPEFQQKDFGVPTWPRPEENREFETRPWSY